MMNDKLRPTLRGFVLFLATVLWLCLGAVGCGEGAAPGGIDTVEEEDTLAQEEAGRPRFHLDVSAEAAATLALPDEADDAAMHDLLGKRITRALDAAGVVLPAGSEIEEIEVDVDVSKDQGSNLIPVECEDPYNCPCDYTYAGTVTYTYSVSYHYYFEFWCYCERWNVSDTYYRYYNRCTGDSYEDYASSSWSGPYTCW